MNARTRVTVLSLVFPRKTKPAATLAARGQLQAAGKARRRLCARPRLPRNPAAQAGVTFDLGIGHLAVMQGVCATARRFRGRAVAADPAGEESP